MTLDSTTGPESVPVEIVPGLHRDRPESAPEGNGNRLPEHLISLPGGGWALWRTLVLRGAGFPARQVLRLAAPETAAASDRILLLEERLEEQRANALRVAHQALDRLRHDGLWEDKDLRRPLMKAMQSLTGGKLPKDVQEPACKAAVEILHVHQAELEAAREDFVKTYQREVLRVSEEIVALAQEDLFREAVLWQNRHAVESGFEDLISKPAASVARTSRRRQNEELVASYLQRYCTKNDTIGFFGPVAFSLLADRGEAVSARCGTGLLQQREVYFEAWCIDTLAEVLGRNPAIRPWLTPRLKSSFFLEDRILHRPFGKPVVLPSAQACLLARCNGRWTARDLARDLVADSEVPLATEEQVYQLLETLCRSRVLTWALKVPTALHPDRALAALLARIEPEPLRAEAMAALEDMRRARDCVALAAGKPAALDAALRDVETIFTQWTGAAPWHRSGETYAARGLLYEDCRRDIEVVFGPALMDRLGPPLDLILRSSRWLAGELTRRLGSQLRLLHAQLRRQAGADVVDCQAFFSSALSSIFFCRERSDTLAEIERELQDRWSRVLGPLPAEASRVRFSASELAARFDAAFENVGPTWTLTRYFSPDVLIAADGEAALQKGDFELILGEIHSGNTLLWSCFLSQHPDPEKISKLLEIDTASSVVVVPQLLQQGWPQRVNLGVILPIWYQFHFTDEPPSGPQDRLLPAGELVVEETVDGLRVRTRDGRVAFHPVDLFAAYLSYECTSLVGAFLEPARHLPRVNVDELVISRERWHFTAAELEFAEIQVPGDRFLELRRWARRLGLPRFCFYKVSTERKPCYLDLHSPISTDIFARFVRGARKAGPEVKVSVSEMTPRLDQTWLRDEAGNLYTCELRLTALEQGV